VRETLGIFSRIFPSHPSPETILKYKKRGKTRLEHAKSHKERNFGPPNARNLTLNNSKIDKISIKINIPSPEMTLGRKKKKDSSLQKCLGSTKNDTTGKYRYF